MLESKIITLSKEFSNKTSKTTEKLNATGNQNGSLDTMVPEKYKKRTLTFMLPLYCFEKPLFFSPRRPTRPGITLNNHEVHFLESINE